MDIYAETEAERRELADTLAGLTPEQWATPSLCAGWTVRDVAAHLLTPLVASKRSVLVDLVRARGSFDRANQLMTARTAAAHDDLAESLRSHAAGRFSPPGVGPIGQLTDVQVHGQDIRRPLGITRAFDPDRLRATLDFLTSPRGERGFVRKGRTAGLRFVADDLDWSQGDGAEVRGTGEAIMLALTGRPVVLPELTGDGVQTLAPRL